MHALVWHKIEETTFANIDLFYFSSFIFKKITATLLKKDVIVDEELDCIDIDDIGNLEDSPRLMFIDKECGNLIAVNNGAKLTRNINQRKKSDALL